MRAVRAQFIAVVLVLVCAGTAIAAVGIVYPKGPDPAVKAWPSWPYPTTCDELAFDPIAVFGGPTEAEHGSGAPEVALQRYLDGGPYPYLPKRFWRVVISSETRVVFSSGRLEFGLTLLDFRLSNGVWAAAGSPGHCRPRTTREGGQALHWRLAADDEIGKGSRRAALEVLGTAGCGSAESRRAALHPELRQVGIRLLLTVWQDAAEGPVCKRRGGAQAISVELPGRLGARQLWDGSSYPPRRVR